MPQCSDSPLVKKLGIKADCRLLLLNEPEDFLARLRPMPDNVTMGEEDELIDVAIVFAGDSKALRKGFPAAKKRLQPAGGLWIAYPKKASKVATDLSEAIVRQYGLDSGLVDNKVCSIDDAWTGLRFVYRKSDR